jgi:hypothetical protein
MEYGYIYIVTDLRNNRKYIGQRKGEFDSTYFGSGRLINYAISKYGLIHFEVKPIDYAFTKEELNELEIQWIKEVDCKFPKGYNLTDGGDGGDTFSGKHHTKEANEKNRKAHLGRPSNLPYHKLDCKCYICKAKRGETKGKGNSMYGRTGSKNSMFNVHRYGKQNPNYRHGKYVRRKEGG